MPIVSEKQGNTKLTEARIAFGRGEPTIENRVGDQTARIDRLAANRVQRLAVSSIQFACIHTFALQLVRIQALHVSSVILVEAGKLVVDEDRGF